MGLKVLTNSKIQKQRSCTMSHTPILLSAPRGMPGPYGGKQNKTKQKQVAFNFMSYPEILLCKK